MRQLLLAAAALLTLLGSWPASAADLSVAPVYKAKRLAFGGCGFYTGIGTHATNENVGIEGQSNNLLGGTGLGGTFTVGASIDALIGYMCSDNVSLKFADARISYQNVGTNSQNAFDPQTGLAVNANVHSKWSAMERVGLGTDWGTVMSFIPLVGALPAWSPLPAGSVDAHAYVFGFALQSRVNFDFDGANTQVWQNRFGVGTGTKFRPSQASSIVLDIWTGYAFAGGGFNINAPGQGIFANANNGRAWLVGMDATF